MGRRNKNKCGEVAAAAPAAAHTGSSIPSGNDNGTALVGAPQSAKDSDTVEEDDRGSVCCAIFTMAMSIPALVGA